MELLTSHDGARSHLRESGFDGRRFHGYGGKELEGVFSGCWRYDAEVSAVRILMDAGIPEVRG